MEMCTANSNEIEITNDYMKMQFDDMEHNNQRPLKITDLCDYVLIKVFSYLDMYDRSIILPQVCKQFSTVSCFYLPKIKEITSSEFLTKKWKSQKNITKLFKRIGPGIKKFKINSSVATKKKKNHFKLMLKSIRVHCSNVENLYISPLVHVDQVTKLPKTIQKFVIEKFHGNLFNLKYLSNLEILHLGLYYVPDGVEWIKVKKYLKDFKLSLELDHIPNVIQINQLLSSVSVNSSVTLSLEWNMSRINFNFLKDFSNLTILVMTGGFVTDEAEINKMLVVLAVKNTVTSINIWSATSNISPRITSNTMSMMLQWTVLEEMYFAYCDFNHSLICGYLNKLKFKTFSLRYGYAESDVESTLPIDLTKDKLMELTEFITQFECMHYIPDHGNLSGLYFHFEFTQRKDWKNFRKQFLRNEPKVCWNLYGPVLIAIEALI